MPTEELIATTLTRTEAEIITVFRQQRARFKSMPSGWVFEVDCNPDRLVATFMDKERVTFKRGEMGNGKHA